MQTFLPYPSFAESARCLDDRRLGKQRVEVLQILRALRGETRGWRNHPATKMWEGYQDTLISYGIAVCLEWRRRGYNDGVLDQLWQYTASTPFDTSHPPWFHNLRFHEAHQASLYQKDPKHYSQFKNAIARPCCDRCKYYWPTHTEKER